MTVLNIVATADCDLMDGSPTFNTGVSTQFRVYLNGGAQVGLIKFDISFIPATTTLTAASMTFTKATTGSNIGTATLSAYGITAANGDWVEGTKDRATAGSGEPCYNAKKADGSGGVTEAWAGATGLRGAGVDYVNTVLGSVSVASTDPVGTQYIITFNAAGLAVIQGWLGTPNTNYGLLMKGNSWMYAFASSEHATEAYRPTLSITYASSTVDLTAADLTLSAVTFDAPTLSETQVPVDITAEDFTLSAVTFDAPVLVAIINTPPERTYTIDAESREYVIPAESRDYSIEPDMRGVKIDIDRVTKFRNEISYQGLTGKDFTLARATFDAPVITNNYTISGNAGVAGAAVTFGAESVTSGVDGSYSITGIAPDSNGSLTITKTGYEFYPQRKYIHTMIDNVTQNFTATQMTTTYYVRKDGNDTTGNGSTDTPWLTIGKAITTAATTGKIYIKVGAGTYEESSSAFWNKNFTNIIVIEPESGNLGDVIVNSTSATNFVGGGATNWRMRKIDFEEGANVTNWNILFGEGAISNIDLIDCRIARNVSTNFGRGSLAVSSTTATNVIIDGCDFPVSQNNCAAIEILPRGTTGIANGITITGCTFPESTGGTTYNYGIWAHMTPGGTGYINNLEISNLSMSDLKNNLTVYVGDDMNAQGAITNTKMYDCTITGDNHVVAFEFGVNVALIDHCTVNAVGTYGFVIKESDNVEISNCTVNSGTNSAIYFKAARGANAHHNTITATQGCGFRLGANLAPDPDTKCANWIFQNNTVNVSGAGKALAIGGDADDAGGGVCDYNTYQNNSGLGAVRNDADVQSLAELQAAWADYDVTTNDLHSVVV